VNLNLQCKVILPDWLEPFLAAWNDSLDGDESRMKLAIALSSENVSRGTGGPFGAIVVAEDGHRLLGAGVNLVTTLALSIAHAEMVALSLAQSTCKDWNLGSQGPVQLVTSCEPCAMCFGAVPWSGVSSLLWGARKSDAEAAGFDEGDKPPDWPATLERRGIGVRGEVLRQEAAAVLARYASGDGAIYHPGTGNGPTG
jgi:tRNA(Arg) A34 adenosine deaminase TadA